MKTSDKPRMLRARKAVGWSLLFMAAGVLVDLGFEFDIVLINYFMFELSIILFITPLIVGASAFDLWRCYRREPAEFPGFWQLALTDLLTIPIFAACMMSGFRFLWPEKFVWLGVGVALVLSAAFAFSLLFVARKGCTSLFDKTVGAFGYLLNIAGLMGAGVILFNSIFEIVYLGSFTFMFIQTLLYLNSEPFGDSHLNVFRILLPCLPIGFILRRWAERRAARSRPTP